MPQIIDLTNNIKSTDVYTNNISEINNSTEELFVNTYNDTSLENEKLIKSRNPNKLLFGLGETAQILGVSYDYIRGHTIHGKIASKRLGKRRMIHLKELTRLLTEGVH